MRKTHLLLKHTATRRLVGQPFKQQLLPPGREQTSDHQRVSSATATVVGEEDLSWPRRKEGPSEEEREGLSVGSAGPSKELIGRRPDWGRACIWGGEVCAFG